MLEWDATAAPVDGPLDPLGRALARGRLPLTGLLEALRRAAADPRVGTLLVKVGGADWPLARAQEVRDAVWAVRRGGVHTVAWAESFGEFSGGSVGYYLATAFDEIWLQPSGDVGLTGVAVQATFVAAALAKLGVRPEIGQRHEYKNAADSFMQTGFTGPHREAAARLAASAAEQISEGIAEARRLPPARLRELIDAAPLSAVAARQAGLVDRIGYRDEVYAHTRRRAGAGNQLLFLSRYAKTRPALNGWLRRRRRLRVVLVEAVGPIHSGRSRRGPFRGPSIGSDTVAAALRAAAATRPAAIVFRVDSPGGSYIASDVIWREVIQARAAGVPVVVSMGDVAASGGYFVAAGADLIVAQPGTLTGSIGVFGGKAVTAQLWERLGVGHDAVAEGRHALMFSGQRGFSADERELLDGWLDRVYADFTAKVAAGRAMTAEQVHEVARGRVWTGSDARARGLVDELGGLARAVELAAAQAGADPGRVRLHRLPVHPLGWLRPPRSSADPRAASASYLGGWGPLATLAARLGLPPEGPLVTATAWGP